MVVNRADIISLIISQSKYICDFLKINVFNRDPNCKDVPAIIFSSNDKLNILYMDSEGLTHDFEEKIPILKDYNELGDIKHTKYTKHYSPKVRINMNINSTSELVESLIGDRFT